MLNLGTVWIDTDGGLLGVNFASKQQKENRVKEIETERQTLYKSLRNFKDPVMEFETDKFKIRIDDMGEGNYRYASWPVGNETNKKPDLILQNGRITFDVSGGNHYYEFKNGAYVYHCEVTVIGTSDDVPVDLQVYKNEKLILEQPAKTVKEYTIHGIEITYKDSKYIN